MSLEQMKRTLIGIFFCTWAVVVIMATPGTDTMVPYGFPSECTSNGNFSFLTSAQEVPPLDFTSSDTAEYNAPSKTMCAIRANTGNALAYTYENGVCTLFGPGLRSTNQTVTFGVPGILNSDSLEEVARNKETYASPHYGKYVKDFGLDGIISDNSKIYYSATGVVHPWWIVDIGEERNIYQVHIYPRRVSAYLARFHDIEIRVGTILKEDGDLSSYTPMSTYKGTYTLAQGVIICSGYYGIVGRFISLQGATKDSANFLEFQEISVFAAAKN